MQHIFMHKEEGMSPGVKGVSDVSVGAGVDQVVHHMHYLVGE